MFYYFIHFLELNVHIDTAKQFITRKGNPSLFSSSAAGALASFASEIYHGKVDMWA